MDNREQSSLQDDQIADSSKETVKAKETNETVSKQIEDKVIEENTTVDFTKDLPCINTIEIENHLQTLDLKLFNQDKNKPSHLKSPVVTDLIKLKGEKGIKVFKQDVADFTCKSCQFIVRDPLACKKC